jgi:uncharacterized protein (TIGR02147 family)
MENVSVTDYNDYRAYLKAVLEDKARKNPTFSLRAFARLSGLSPSHLSRAMSGQKRLSATTAHLISSSLGHSPREASHLLNLIELEKATDERKRGKILSRLSTPKTKPSQIVPIEAFRAIADWYHFAILGLTNTKNFQDNAQWIARRLGIKPLEAKFAVERLVGLDLLKQTKKGLRVNEEANITTTDDVPSAAINENHRQHLELATRALKEIEVELREFNNVTLAMNLSDIPKAKKMIRAFIDHCNSELETIPGQELYQLNIQLYPLTRTEKGLA